MNKGVENSAICIPGSEHPKIVVIGAGFAGIHFIKQLRNKPVQIILLDKNNFHQFQPLLYQVAIAGLEPDSIIYPIRKMFQGYQNLVYRMADVVEIQGDNKRIITNIGWVDYDYLVIATGSDTNFYGQDYIEKNSIGLKSIRDALDIRSWVLQNLEEAVITCSLKEKDALTNFVIVGGGPAGVELAGALAEFKRFLLHKDYPEITSEWMKIYLLEAGPRLLPTMSEKASAHALQVLEKLDVKVLLNIAVRDYDGMHVMFDHGKLLNSKFLVWTAGVKGNIFDGLPFSSLTKNGRIRVDEYNQVNGLADIFAMGDVASMISIQHPKGHPMVAQVAIQQGVLLAKNILHLLVNGEFQGKFAYKDKGSMAAIGKKNAVADFKKFKMSGRLAWLLWSAVHLVSIIGFKNKLMVAINWATRYLTYEKANRLIIRKFSKGQTKKQDLKRPN